MNETKFISKDEIKLNLLISTYAAIIAHRTTSNISSTDSYVRLLINEALESIEKQLEKK